MHQVTIKNNKVTPELSVGHLCDKITFTNLDNVDREIAFGPHEHHVAYDGISERIIGKNQSFSITLDKVGKYRFHDHIHDTLVGYFDVYSN